MDGTVNESKARAEELGKCQPKESAEDRCQTYARTAVRQNTENLQRRCGYTGARWQSNYGAHFEWCKGAGKAPAEFEQAARVSDLAKCVTPPEPSDDLVFCRQHARLAVAEYNENIRRGCRLEGRPGWSADEEGHFQWCMHNGRGNADAWHNGRMKALANCNPSNPNSASQGYQLYFDGKLVSGPDAAGYTFDDARRNCIFNTNSKPHLRVICVFNGQEMKVR